MEKRYISVGILTSDYGQPDCNLTKGKRMFVEVPPGGTPGNFSEEYVTKLENDGTAVVLIEREAGRVIHLTPRGDLDKWTMFGGTFVHTSDSRFPYAHPIKLHDRYEG